jgi:membrane fusion protein, copper/silver efflux system
LKNAVYSVAVLVAVSGAFLVSWYGTTATGRAAVQPPSAAHAHAGSVRTDPNSAAPHDASVTLDGQRMLGVRVSPVEKVATPHTLRTFGRVAPDEARLYKVNAGIEGSIHEVSSVTTGSRVTKDQRLATFIAPNALSVIQFFILNSDAADRVKAQGSVEGQAAPLVNSNILQRLDQLRNLGMSARQMDEIGRTRQLPASIDIVAPADGFVLSRNVSPGLKFDRGTEFYRIADLRRVWILADVFDNDARYVRPGIRAQVSLPNQRTTFAATVADVLPQFDTTTRTLKVRLEVDNPGYVMRPDMFVDVTLAITAPPSIVVPVDAVLDSGLAKTVFVERGDGAFEPRKVETGSRFGDRVEIVGGLSAGERIATSGAFLLESESRMRSAVVPSQGLTERGHPHGGEHGAHATPGEATGHSPAHDAHR